MTILALAVIIAILGMIGIVHPALAHENTVKVADKVLFGKFFQKMLANGVYLAPSQFEAGFISTLHTDDIIDRTIEAVTESFRTW